MEILKILKKSRGELYLEDLDFFETELATGDYDKDYIEQCISELRDIRKWITGEPDIVREDDHTIPSGLEQPLISLTEHILGNDTSPEANRTMAELICADILALRKSETYKADFKQYVEKCAEIDAEFIDAHYSFFQPWEIQTLLTLKQMGEPFLEKYFDTLDRSKVARYQQFSEGFFIKHFAKLDPNLVLTRGKNPWRKKEKRSKQLDVFLRLKGVKV